MFISLVFFSCGEGINETEEAAEETVVTEEAEIKSLSVCSFNIQWIGISEDRDDASLAKILEDYDIVVVQELVSPPYPGIFPDETSFKTDPQSAEFFDKMNGLGFKYILSEEDTGTGDTLHTNRTWTEWWVTFYKPGSVKVADELPSGFLAEKRANHDDYERVPYAFAFSSPDDNLDFVLISVHLKPDPGPDDRARRKHELAAIANWIKANDETEKDFIILGDMNIYKKEELEDATPEGYVSLNDECVATNTNINTPHPYDHVMYNKTYTTEIDEEFDFQVVNLIEKMKPFWDQNVGLYPGDPYDHNEFKKYYSDHHPVVFKMIIPENDDD